MTSRRSFLGGLLATGLCPRPSWADAGSPACLSAAQIPDGSYRLAGLSGDGDIIFTLPLPGRGHAAAAHPTRPEAVGFARRPGTFAFVLNCVSGQATTQLTAPTGRHFYGHGTYFADGTLLFTTENDFEAGAGVIGVWDVTQGYGRIGEFSSGGIGPHDIKLMPGGGGLVIANGGIETHPDMGRSKLNLATMRPNLSYVSTTGTILEQVELPQDQHRNSIRHLATGADGLVAFGMQWQGDTAQNPALLGLHRPGEKVRLLRADAREHRRLQGYVGSVAMSADGTQLAATSPRGGIVQVFDIASGAPSGTHEMPDVCGLSTGRAQFLFTSGTGAVGTIDHEAPRVLARPDCAWDNHLVDIAPG